MKSVRLSILGLLFGAAALGSGSAEARLPEAVRTVIKKIAKKYVYAEFREYFYDEVKGSGLVGNFNMQKFDEATEPEQIAMVEELITQFVITDDFIAWNLRLNKTTVTKIREECAGDYHKMAEKLAARVRRINFFKNNWGKILVVTGVGLTAATAGLFYYLNNVLLNNTQLR